MVNSAYVSLPRLEINVAANFLQAGGLLLYPTETFWAIGCLPFLPDALEAIYRVKGRFQSKPLPLLAANREQVGQIANLKYTPAGFLDRFWPGPLTVVLPQATKLPGHLVNQAGKVAVRVSASPIARTLTELTSSMITCSSANIQAHMPGESIEELDADFWRACEDAGAPVAICDVEPEHSGKRLPSSIVEPEYLDGEWKLKIIREGAISAQTLHNWKQKNE